MTGLLLRTPCYVRNSSFQVTAAQLVVLTNWLCTALVIAKNSHNGLAGLVTSLVVAGLTVAFRSHHAQ